MAKQLSAEQKTIGELLGKRGAKFLIPDYQRPYSWEREQCETLWEDLKAFAFPPEIEFNADKDTYFLGSILTYENDGREDEVIDGQQRLITLLLLLRAFYTATEKIQCTNKEDVLSGIAKCIWITDEFGRNPRFNETKLESKVISDEDEIEFKKILTKGECTEKNMSNYAANYRYFQSCISKFKESNLSNFSLFPMRILNNSVLLPIKVDSQSTALRIFRTLNDRGLQLSDSDIFKAQFYKFYLNKGTAHRDEFVRRWKNLENLCRKNFLRSNLSLDEIFTRYMYYDKTKRAVEGNTTISQTFVDMRDFYGENNYAILRRDGTFDDLETLAQFWDDVESRSDRFSAYALKRLYVLNYSPYGIWTHVVSIYFMGNRNLNDEKFCCFLDKLTAVILVNAILDLGKQGIRSRSVPEFKNIFNGKPLVFEKFKQPEKFFRRRLSEMKFTNRKPITRSMLIWWAFQNPLQELPPLDKRLEIEHIYPKKRHELHPLTNPESLECLGNKAMLEEYINIRASDYRFADKKKYYLGWQPHGKGKKYQPGTFNSELRRLAEESDDFTENDILDRNEKIFDAFIAYLREQDLLT